MIAAFVNVELGKCEQSAVAIYNKLKLKKSYIYNTIKI